MHDLVAYASRFDLARPANGKRDAQGPFVAREQTRTPRSGTSVNRRFDGQRRLVDVERFRAVVGCENHDGVLCDSQIIDRVKQLADMPVVLEGYPPPESALIGFLKVTPDPGVIEVNIHPATMTCWPTILS